MQKTNVSAKQLSQFILENQLWQLKENKLHREFIFSNFILAFDFMTQTAHYCESLNHHPEWSNEYNKVVVDLTTHESKGISAKDFMLAQAMNKIADQLM